MDHALPLAPRRIHLTRLMAIWRSAGWPCRDAIELDVVAAGWAVLVEDAGGRETIRLTDAGIRVLAESRQRNQRSLSAHDRLAARVAEHLMVAGRIVWRELSLRARINGEAATSASEASGTGNALWLDDEVSIQRSPQGKASWRMARPDVFSVRRTTVEDYLQPMVHEIKVRPRVASSRFRQAHRDVAVQATYFDRNWFWKPLAIAAFVSKQVIQ